MVETDAHSRGEGGRKGEREGERERSEMASLLFDC